jgi:hypothetical protein
MKVKCHCKNIDFGTYENTVTMISPFTQYDICGDLKQSNIVCIDTCIATIIGWLWHQGVDTTNSCCGHGKYPPSVIVTDESIDKMKELGYKETKIECANPNNTFDL